MQQASQFLHKARARRQLNSISRRESEILLPSLLWFDFIAVGVVRAVRWRGCLFLSFHVFYLSLLGTTARITQTCAWWYAGCREVKVLKCRKRVCSPRSSRRKRLAATKRPDCRVEPRFAREEHKRCEIKFNKIIANFDHLIIFHLSTFYYFYSVHVEFKHPSPPQTIAPAPQEATAATKTYYMYM